MVDNNSVLRRLRYALNFNDAEMAEMVSLGGMKITPGEIAAILKREDEAGFESCRNEVLIRFLDGLIIHRRGPSDRPHPSGERLFSVTNNLILKKLRIAFELREEGMVRVFKNGEYDITGTELTALFRKPGHRNYRECGDQLLKRFLTGLSVRKEGGIK